MEISGIKIKPAFSTNKFDEITNMLKTKYTVAGFIDGTLKKSNKINNPIWVVLENNQYYLLLLCSDLKTITKLCFESYNKILNFEKEINNDKKIKWNVSTNGYICGSVLNIGVLYMHQIIMNYYRHGAGTSELSVDHIDRDPYNNTLSNLRLATCKEQNNNQKGVIPGTKRDRQRSARDLPEGILQEDMPKYVTYNVNIWDKEKNKTREFFCIERHPLLYPKVWEGTKSSKVSIQDKLIQIKKILENLNNGILPKYVERGLPKHVYFTIIRNINCLIYDNRNTKHTKKLAIKDETFDINNIEKREKQLYILNHRVMKTYGEDESFLPEDYEYIGEPIAENELDESLFELPKYVCLLNEKKGNTILSFHRIVNDKALNKKIKLPNNYNLQEPTPQLMEDIETTIPLLNKEIIKKYGSEFAIIEVTNEDVKTIMKEKQEQQINGFPKFVRIQTFQTGNYFVFDKKVDKKRLYTNMKLPNNYNKNKELHKFNQKIIEVYGEEYKLDLSAYPYEDKEIKIPENMYVVINSKTPYMFIIKNNKSVVYKFPERYDLQSEIDKFYESNDIPPNNCKTNDEWKNDEEWKIKNISITNKAGKPSLLYQKRCNEYTHSVSILLPSAPFDMYLYLLEMNNRIISRYGKEHSIFM